jgi:hypothetical protein
VDLVRSVVRLNDRSTRSRQVHLKLHEALANTIMEGQLHSDEKRFLGALQYSNTHALDAMNL